MTAHEVYARSRDAHNVEFALRGFEFLRAANITVFDFLLEDEVTAKTRLVKWGDHKISFIDAICASVMLPEGIYKSSPTIATSTSIAEAYYGGVPEPIRVRALAALDEQLRAVVAEFVDRFGCRLTRGI